MKNGYDIAVAALDKTKKVDYTTLRQIVLKAYELEEEEWAQLALDIAARYAGQGGEYEVLGLFQKIVAIVEAYSDHRLSG